MGHTTIVPCPGIRVGFLQVRPSPEAGTQAGGFGPHGAAPWRRSDVALEVSGDVGLIAKADADRDICRRLPVEEPLTRDLDSPAESVDMRGEAERLRASVGLGLLFAASDVHPWI